MDVFRDRKRLHLTGAAPCDHDRQLALEVDELLDDAALLRKRSGGPGQRRIVGNLDLAFAIVAEIGRFHHARQADLANGGAEIVAGLDLGEWHGRKVVFAQPVFLAHAVLAGLKNVPVRMKLHMFLDGPERFGRDVLELVSDHINAFGESRERLDVGVGPVGFQRGYFARRTIGLGFVDMNAIAETFRRVGKHAAELAAAEDTDGFARRDHEGS